MHRTHTTITTDDYVQCYFPGYLIFYYPLWGVRINLSQKFNFSTNAWHTSSSFYMHARSGIEFAWTWSIGSERNDVSSQHDNSSLMNVELHWDFMVEEFAYPYDVYPLPSNIENFNKAIVTRLQAIGWVKSEWCVCDTVIRACNHDAVKQQLAEVLLAKFIEAVRNRLQRFE